MRLSITNIVILIAANTAVSGGLMSNWTVWVGGSEINSHYLSQAEAISVARAWIDEGYSDVIVGEVNQ